METSQTYDDNKQLSKDIVNKQHPSCPHSGGMHFAPPRCKDAVYAKQKERQCFYYLKGECNKGESCNFSHSGVPNLGSGGVRQPFGGRGRGRGRGRKGRGRGGHNKRSGAFGYSPTTGKPYETLAIANHAKEQRAAGAATTKQTSPPKKLKLDAAAVEEIYKAGRQSRQNTKRTDSDDDDGGLKALLVKYKQPLMICVRSNHALKRSNDQTDAGHTRSAKKLTTVQSLIGGMDSGSSVGIDSCSAVNVTTRREDAIYLNNSPDSLSGLALSGVGGSANLIGAFLWLVPLQEALIPQDDGSYVQWHDAWLPTGNMQSSVLMKYTEQQGHIRVLSTEMLKANGLVVRAGIGPDNKDYLLCKKSGVLIPMHSERGLQVIKTRKVSASTIQNNVHIKDWVNGLKSLLHWENKNVFGNAKAAIEADKIPIARLGKQDIQFPRMSNSYKLLIAQHVNEHHGSEEAVHDEERLQYQDMVTDELKTKLSALGSQDTTERSANSRRALAMQ